MSELTRRGFLKGFAGIVAASVAPAIILSPGLLMPGRPTWVASQAWPMREIFAYDIMYDAMRVRYDVMVDGMQMHVDDFITTQQFKEGSALLTASYARKKLTEYARNQGLDVTRAVPLMLPRGLDKARIIT
jgi:hypothetical protein